MNKTVLSLLVSATMAVSYSPLSAQKSEVNSAQFNIESSSRTAESILDAKLSIDKAAVHPTTLDFYKMWLYRAIVYTRVYESRDNELLKPVSVGSGYVSAYSMMRFWKSTGAKKMDIETGVIETRNSFGVAFNEASDVVDQKLYDSAVKYYQVLLFLHGKMDTADINGLERSGITYKYLQERLAALAMYVTNPKVKLEILTELVDGGSKSPLVFEGLSRVYLENGDTAGAERIVRKGIAAAPGDNAMFQLLVNYYVTINRVDLLFDDVNKQLETNPTSRLYFIRGTLNERRDSFDRAMADYRSALGLDEFNYDANYNLGVALIKFETKKYYDAKAKAVTAQEKAKIDKQLRDIYTESRKLLEMASTNKDYSVSDQLNIYKALKTAALELDDKAGADGYDAKIKVLESINK